MVAFIRILTIIYIISQPLQAQVATTSSGKPADVQLGLAHVFLARERKDSSDSESEEIPRRSSRSMVRKSYESGTESDVSSYTRQKRRQAQVLRRFESSGSEDNYEAGSASESESTDQSQTAKKTEGIAEKSVGDLTWFCNGVNCVG